MKISLLKILCRLCLQVIIREAVGRGGGTASLPCPIINAPNRNETGIPALTRQDRPIEIVSLYIPFRFVCTEDRAQWFPVVGNMSQTCFQVLSGEFSETRWCLFPLWKLYFKNCYPKIWTKACSNEKKNTYVASVFPVRIEPGTLRVWSQWRTSAPA